MAKNSRTEKEDKIISKRLLRACREISRLTQIPLNEIPENSYALVTEKTHPRYAQIGVYRFPDHSAFPELSWEFQFKRKLVPLRKNQIFFSMNLVEIIAEREKILGVTGKQFYLDY